MVASSRPTSSKNALRASPRKSVQPGSKVAGGIADAVARVDDADEPAVLGDEVAGQVAVEPHRRPVPLRSRRATSRQHARPAAANVSRRASRSTASIRSIQRRQRHPAVAGAPRRAGRRWCRSGASPARTRRGRSAAPSRSTLSGVVGSPRAGGGHDRPLAGVTLARLAHPDGGGHRQRQVRPEDRKPLARRWAAWLRSPTQRCARRHPRTGSSPRR